MRQGCIRHGGAQRRMTYGAYAKEGAHSAVPLTHASMSALGAYVPMCQTRARSRGRTVLPPYVIFHAPRALISLCL